MPDPVLIAEPDPRWSKKFDEECERLRAVFGDRLRGLEHIGSTSVRGLAAKPVIDILVGLETLAEVLESPKLLEAHGWEFPASINDELFDRRFGKKLENGDRTHHVHIVVFEGDEWKRLVAFRNALRADPELRERYESMKRDLATKYKDERAKYTAAKTDFIAEVLASVGAPALKR